MRRHAPPVPRRWLLFVCLGMLISWISTPAAQQSARPIVDPNVNMVRGITFPDGDPYLQRQNEPSIAVSTRNPCHLVAGANDYRSVDIPFDNTDLPGGANAQPNQSLAGDAWLGLFKSFDCGQKWSSTLLPGYPQDTSNLAPQLKGYDAGADPTVRAGTNGLFYYSGMVFDRGAQGDSKIFVARLIDNNNKERGDPIQFIDVATIDIGTKGQFLDKPWLAVDVPRNSFGPGSTLATSGSGPTCDINGQVIPSGNVYMVWARFTGDSSDHSKLMFAKSSDCGRTWKTRPISNRQTISQGGNIAIAPHDGTVHLTWREFISPDKPVQIWSSVSSDGGESFSNPRSIALNPPLFDQLKSSTTFRTNALPAIVADHEDRVYVAWSQRGFGASYVNDVLTLNNDARIVMSVSSDRGRTWGAPFAIDPSTRRGHQVMPSLTFAAGKIQAIYYDAREDVSGVFKDYIDDKDVTKLRHTIDVRGAQATPAPQPVFVTAGLESFEISRYRTWNVGGVSMEIGSNPPNLAMYSAGTMPFMGDYIDVSGLPSFPIQTSAGQVWQPNIGPINLMGASASSVMANGFPTLPIFHATWTDNRDVRYVGSECQVPPDPAATGERNANIYTARLTPGLYVGSPGNTKPLGYRVDPVTQQPTGELIQRGFVVFAQNTTNELKFFQFDITNQPPGGRASFRQFDRPLNGTPTAPLTTMVVSVPKSSTMARTVYATSTDPAAQILVNVQEVTPILSTSAEAGSQSQGGLSSLQTTQSGGKTWTWVPANTGLRGSILLNPDRTNPKILDPDLDSEVPKIASDEVHDPSMFEAQFFRHAKNIGSRMLDVKNPDPENPDPENPDPENPDPENPDPENPDPENPDPENPDPENPDPENPDPENPDPENTGVLNTALSDADVTSSSITDVNWRVHNSGNTTSAYRFGPSIARTKAGEKYQLIVTRRYMTLTIDPKTCKPIYKSQNQVLVNIQNFKPRTPDPENPDPENPDPENPDPENPDPENPDPENPDPENPDPENASFFLSPDETATVTLRVFTPDGEDPPDTEEEVAGKTAAQAANTGETEVTTAVSGPDLALSEPEPTFTPPAVRPGATITVNWTLTNRGTAGATSPSGTIKNNVYFSTNATLDRFDTKIGNTVTTPATLAAPFPHCPANAVPEDPAVCRRTFATPVTMPATPGQYYVIITTDEDNDADEYDEQGDPLPENDNEVFEADELNNVVVVPVTVDAYQLTFVQQPSTTTQDFTIAPPVVVAVTHPDGQPVAMADVPAVTLAIQNDPAPGGILSGTTVQPTVGGLATFGDLRIDRAAAGYTLAATAPFSMGVISAAFTIEADLPPTAANESYTTPEDTALTVAAPGVLTNDSDPPTQGVAPEGYGLHASVNTEPQHGSVALNTDGSFTYTPHAGFGGSDSFTYHARDGRAGNQAQATVTITVTSINDAPSFTAGPNQSVVEDSGPQTVPNWATNISAGAGEPGQAVDFIVTNDNNALFSAQPALTPAGTLTFTPAANANGVANITVRIHDNGGTANGGVDTSAPQTFAITVIAAPDAPVASPDAYTITEDTVLGVDASGFGGLQGLLFNDTDADAGTSLVAEYLTTTTNGTLLPHANGSFSYTPNANFYGTDSFTYRAVDPQNNASNTVTVTIDVLERNDAPSFTKGADQTAPSGNVTQTVPGWATAISAGPANESSQLVDFLVTNDNNGLFNVQPAVSANGTLSFTPKQNANGTTTVTVRIHDNGGTANGGVDTSAPQTFVITVTSTVQNYVVTNTNDSGNGSLRAAIINANANASADVISFDIAGGGVRTITPLSPLPAIVFPVNVNATTQPGYSGSPLIELNGSSAGAGANGFSIGASNVTIRGFVINRFGQSGISITGPNNVVAGNYIGTDAAGTLALGNQGNGIFVEGSNNVISLNRVAHNAGVGILISTAISTANRISQNQIHDNGGLGIDLGASGVTANDAGDADSGANNLQNYPVLTAAFSNGVGTTVAGTLNSTPNTAFTLELFSSPAADPSGYGEGRLYIGSLSVITDGSGIASFAGGIANIPAGQLVTATTIDPAGNTSELSQARVVVANNPPTATNDSTTLVSGSTATLSPATNDVDPDVISPSVVATYSGLVPGLPSLVGPGDMAIVSASGVGYFTGGNLSAAARGSIGILDLATNTITGTIPNPVQGGSNLARVNQTTRIAYLRINQTLVAIDGRPGPGQHQVLLSRHFGTIQSMAIDETRGRLYLGRVSGGAGTVTASHITVLDVDPNSPTFHSVIREVTLPSGPTVTGIAVNTATNRIYANSAGLVSIDGATWASTIIGNTASAFAVAVNEGENLVYTVAGTTLTVVDGATDTVLTTITLPASASTGQFDSRLAIHQGTDRVYVRLAEFPNPSRLVIIDGKRTSGTFNTIVATLTIGRELGGSTSIAVDEDANRVVVTSAQDLKVTVVDAITDSIVGSVTSPQLLTRATIDPATHRAYVAGGTGAIKVVELVKAALHATVPLGAEIFGFAVDPATHTAYVAETSTTAAVKRIGEGGFAGSVALPHGDGRESYVVRNPNTNRIYALNSAATAAGGSDALPGFVHVINGATNAVIATVPVGPIPFGMGLNPVTNKIYVGNGFAGASFPGGITVIDGATNTAVQADVSQIPQNSTVPGQIQVGRDIEPNTATGRVYFRILSGSPTQVGVLSAANVATSLGSFVAVNTIRVNPVLNRIYVGTTQSGDNLIHVFDGATDAEIATIQAGFPTNFIGNQSYLAINRTTGRLFAANFLEGTLEVIDGTSNTVVATVPVGAGPSTVAVNESANRIYVGNAIERTLSIIDGATLRVVRTLPLGMAPVSIQVDESSPARVFVEATAAESKLVVVVDPGTGSPMVTSVTQGASGTVTLNADGTVSYDANAGFSGTDSFTYTADDGSGGTTTGTVAVTVAAPLVVNVPATPPSTVGSPYSLQLSAAGGTAPYEWSLSSGTWPSGLNLNTSTGAITGSTMQAGTFTFTVQARDSAVPPQTATGTLTISVGPPVITTLGLPAGFINQPYSQALTVGGATGAVTWTINTNNNPLLGWLSLSADGTLSGTPIDPGQTASFTVTATDSLNQSASRSLSVFVNAPLDVFPPREGIVLEAQPSFSFIGGSGTRTITKTAGELPPGLTLNASGSFTGTPLRHGEYAFTVDIKDCQLGGNGLPTCNNQTIQQVVSRNLTLRVSAKDQQGSSANNGSIAFGGPGGRRLAQVLTVGAQGTLTAVGFSNLSCPAVTPVTVEIQRLGLDGRPDGNTIASGSAVTNFSAIAIAPPLAVAIDERLAIVVSSPVTCTGFGNSSTSDGYNAGDAFADAGGGWQPLFTTDGRYDLPSFRTLIQPAMDVGYLRQGRSSSTATALNDGTVLLVGGTQAEVYDPATNATTLTGAMITARIGHTTTRLADGKVLVTGGRTLGADSVRLASAEIFDPATGTFTAAANAMSSPRESHRAIRLGDGRVLVTGGQNEFNTRLASADLFDPATLTFSPAPNMAATREQHTMTLLANGKVLVAAGYVSGPGAETFDPATNTFTITANSGNMVVNSRGHATATLLADGKVLIAGGQSGGVRSSAELYDPATNAFTATGSLLGPRFMHAADVLPDGSVLIAGGYDQQPTSSYILPLASLERYVPGAGTFAAAGAMETRRQQFSAVALPGGNIVLGPAFSQSWMSGNTVEVYDPSAALTITPTTLADAPLGQPYAAVVLNASGGTGAYTIAHASGVIPPGMGYDQNTRTLSGTPTATGVYTMGFLATDTAGNSVVQSLTLRVGTINVITSPYRLTDGALTAPYSVQLAASGTPPIVWSLAPASSALPPGLTLNSSGVIAGTPTVTGYYNFAVRALDSTGQLAIKTLSISIQQPLTILTTTLNNVDLFGGGPGCISAQNGVGTRTWSISNGALPTGLAINSTNGCFTGSVTATGAFTFTVQVTDSASPPQVASRQFTVNSWAVEQSSGADFFAADLTFGGGTNRRLGQRIITGVTGTLAALRLNSITCPAGAVVTASIQGMTPAGTPDGNTIVSGSAIAPLGAIVLNGGGEFFAADSQFALLLEADQSCAVKPQTFDIHPGEGFVSTGGGNWQTLQSFDGRYDIPFTTLITPAAGLTYMSSWRGDHTSTVLPLPNGKVLIAGGGSSSAELFDPNDNSSTPLPAMTSYRSGHTATLLSDSKVLLAGGQLQNGTRVATAEIFDAATNTFTATGMMTAARQGHTATRLNDGTVLIAGGMTNNGPNLQTAEIYDPNAGTFTAVGNMTQARQAHTATLLDDGRVLIGAGYPAGNSAELYLPDTQTFVATDGFMSEPRGQHTATLLADGKVLITGGNGASGNVSSGAEIFDPAAGANGRGTFSNTAGGMSVRRIDHTATLLADGSVLISGGYTDTTCCFPHAGVATLERYVPALNSFEGAGTMLASRSNHSASKLADGRVLFSGTYGWSNLASRSAEPYDVDSAPRFQSTAAPRGESGQPYSLTLFPAGGTGAPYTATIVSGSLPAGIQFNAATMTFSGTATESGTFPLTLSLSDSSARTTYHIITLRFDTLVILTGALPTAYQGVEYLGAGFAGQGIGNITWTMSSGTLPPGLTFNSPVGSITGTPTVSCCYYSITVKATDEGGQTAYQTVIINVQAPLNITTLSLGDGTAGNSYGGCVFANNGSGPRTWSLSGNVPPGLSIDQNTGCFNAAYPANVIRQAGTFAFTVHVADSSVPAQTDAQNFTIRLHAQDQWPGSSSAPSPVSLPASRRVAQVYRAASAFPLSAVQLNNFTCDPSVQVTVNAWPVTGAPPRPDESGSPLATLSATADVNGNLPWVTSFASPVAMPQGARFALVLSFSGQCAGNYWPTNDWYGYGEAWLDDGGGWTRAATAIGRYEIPMQTLVMPPSSLPFLDNWRDAGIKLPDGRLVLFGGDKTAEIYNPAANTITNFGQMMPTYRYGATASLLSNGKILLAGGRYYDNNLQQDVLPATTDIYDPATGQFTAGPALPAGRYGHSATKLASGRILIAGGWNVTNGVYTTLDSALLIEADGSVVTPLTMTGARVEHTATLLSDQRVLILGGWTGEPWPPTVAEIYDPASGPNGSFTQVNANMPWWPSQHTATLLPNGTVLIAGGVGPNYPDLAPDSMIFDPAGPSFTNAPSMLVPRLDATAVTLGDGRIAFLGGSSEWAKWAPTSIVEIYNPISATFVSAGNLIVDRVSPIAAPFIDGNEKLMIAGSGGSSTMSGRTVEIFDTTSTPVTITNVTLPAGQTGQAYTATLTAAGGTPAYLFSLAWGQLPPGLQLLPEGEFSGTPSSTGPYSFVVQVTDSVLASAYREFTIVVDKLTIASPQTLPNAVNGVYYEYQFTLSGGTGPFTWSSSSLPGGASLTPAGLLFGTFNANGWSGGTVSVTDASGQTAMQNFNFQVVEPFSLSAGIPFLGIATEFYHYDVQPQGGTAPYSWTIDSGTLLPGLQLNQFGSIQGFPTRTGRFEVTVKAADAGQPPQMATLVVQERVTAIDQRAPGGAIGNTVAIHSSQTIAQTLTVRANAPLYAVRAPIDCSSGTLTLRIRNVEPGGEPGAVILASGSFASPVPLDEKFPIFIPLFLRAGDRVAVEFSSADGNCVMMQPSIANDNYAGGAAYVDTGLGWVPMDGVQDFKVETLVDLPDLQFTPTFRGGAQVTLAASGQAQITGNSQQVSAYDPALRTLVDRPSAIAFRSEGTATALSNGKILLAGGYDGTNVTGAAELYDPATNTTTPTSEPMDAARKQHTATLLADGKVLIAGGVGPDGVTFVQMAEIYDPVADTFSQAGNMVTVRSLHQATRLPSGKVLITGGASNGSQTMYTDAELYTPGVGFAASADTMTRRRFKHRDVAVADGRVLITGGQNFDFYETVDDVEVYDENCDCFTADGFLTIRRQLHTATLLANGTVLVAGGVTVPDSEEAEASMEQIFVSPVPGASSALPVGSMDVARAGHDAVRLCPGGGCAFENHVLFAGGFTQDAAQHSVETFDPDDIQMMAQWGAGYFGQVTSALATPAFTIVSGALPGGLSLGAGNGFITGSPTQVGQFTFTVRITDGPNLTEYKTLTLTVFP